MNKSFKVGGTTVEIERDGSVTTVSLQLIREAVQIKHTKGESKSVISMKAFSGTAAGASRVALLMEAAAGINAILWGTVNLEWEEQAKYLSNFLQHKVTLPPSLDLSVKPGTRIRYSLPNHGYLGDQFRAYKMLVPGRVYTVKHIVVGNSYASVALEEIPDTEFNTVHFVREPEVTA